MEYGVSLNETERNTSKSISNHQKFHFVFENQQMNSLRLDDNIKTLTDATPEASPMPDETVSFQTNNKFLQYPTNSCNDTKQTIKIVGIKNAAVSDVMTAESTKTINAPIMEISAMTHINLVDDEEEKDPLALDSSSEQTQLQENRIVKHTHSLRRHVPRIIVKPILPERKTTNSAISIASTTLTTTTMINSITSPSSLSSISPSSRGCSSRRIQQQQQAKAAAAAAAAAGNATSSATSSVSTTTLLTTAVTQASTMREVLASIPGFSLKPRRRSSKKISTAAQIEQTKDGKIDLETPDSILASTNLRALLNKQTFSLLPPLYQFNLIQLLPSVDREAIEMEREHSSSSTLPMEAIRLGSSSLNNEFFARACLEWRERLSEGEFTPENQVKLKTEAERERNKLDPWKIKHFEPIWGEKVSNRACTSSSSNSSITINKNIDGGNIAINRNTGSFKTIGDKLDFKLESKDTFPATTIARATPATLLKSNEKNEVKMEKQNVKSIIECRLDQNQSCLPDDIEIKEEKELAKISNDRKEREQHFCDSNKDAVDNNNAHLQNRIQDESKCDKQTETYIKIEANERNYTVSNKTNDLILEEKGEPSSVFDLLRKQENEYEHCNQQQKRGTKRGSSDIFLSSDGSGFDNDSCHKQASPVEDAVTENFVERNKFMKIEATIENVPKKNKSSFVSCTMDLTKPIYHQHLLTSSSAVTAKPTTTEAATTPSEIIHMTQITGEDPSCSDSSASSQKLTFTQDVLEKLNAVEQEKQMRILQKQQQQNVCRSFQLKSMNPTIAITPSTTTTTNLQYFVNTNQNVINIKSTCDSTKDALIATIPTTINITTKSKKDSTIQQNDTVINMVPLCEGVVAEQNFADAENYVLQSGDISTDSGDTVNVQDATAVTVGTSSKNYPNEVISDDCENIYESNKSILTTSISSVTTSSSSSSSSSSTSSSPATSSAVTTTDMQEIFSAGNSLSNTLFHASQQQRSQIQQQQQDRHHQQQTLKQQSVVHQQQTSHGYNLTNNSGGSNSSSSSGSTATNNSRHNELFQHVQHDWNFGGLKLQQNIEKDLNDARQNQAIKECQQQQMILQPAGVHEEHQINDQSAQDIEECASISAQLAGHDLIGRQIITSEAVVADTDAGADEDDDGDVGDGDDDDDDADDDDDEGDGDDDEDELDDSDAVRDIVDELQQQHQQMLNEQRQQQEQLQQLHASDQRQNIHQIFPTEHLEYSNELSESLSPDVLCDVPISAAEMEVTSTVTTNSNSNDENSNELSLFSGAANISNTGINHMQQLPSQTTQVAQQQRQILIDSNGQLIRNFLVQQQQLQQQQQQLLQHAQQLAAFQQRSQHHQPAVNAMPQSTATLQQQTSQQPQHQAQTQLLHSQQHKTPTLSMQVIHRRPFESSTNGQPQIFQHNIAPTAVAATAHPQQIEPSNQQQHQQQQQHQLHFALQQQQQRNFFTQNSNTAPHSSTSNNLISSQHSIQLHAQQQQQRQQHHTHHQQQVPTFHTQVHQPTPSQQQTAKFLPRQLNIISMPRSTTNISSTPALVAQSPTPAYTYNTSPTIGTPLHAAASVAAAATNQLNSNILAHQQQHQPTPPPPPPPQLQQQQQQLHVTSNSTTNIRSLPSTPVVGGIPTTIAQHRLMMTKMPSGKGRKTVNNKLPPGAVNLERSYQICQAVIQNSPNRESLKAQLRPPPATLGQQQQQQQQQYQQQQQSSGGSSPSSTSLSNSCSSASSSPSSLGLMIKNEDIMAPSTALPASIPPNVMGVGRPNVYKVIGPRMGFPRKKYVQRQPSPTMIRHIYAAPTGGVALPTSAQQLSLMQQQQQQAQQHHHSQLHAPAPHHEIHQNGSGQYVLVHRANVGAADNQAPRASSAPPVAQNQHQFRGMNGIPITGRGRPASVDVDTSNTVHDIHQPIHGANAANIVRRNISAGNITYIDNYSATPTTALIDGNNYIAAAAAAASAATTAVQSTDAGSENTPPVVDGNNCACSLNAMVICQQCGAFCHDDCVNATRLCVSCVIR